MLRARDFPLKVSTRRKVDNNSDDDEEDVVDGEQKTNRIINPYIYSCEAPKTILRRNLCTPNEMI